MQFSRVFTLTSCWLFLMIIYLLSLKIHKFCIDHVEKNQGIVAEWLSRKTRNLVPSGASVRIWPMSLFFVVESWCNLCVVAVLRVLFLLALR
jgi:hypothetical protein